MKKSLLIALLFCFAANAQIAGAHRKIFGTAGIAFVSLAVGDDSVAQNTVATSSWNIAAGNAVVCYVRSPTSTDTITVADTSSTNTFASISTIRTGTAGALQIFRAYNTVAKSGDVITATTSGNVGTHRAILCMQFSGLATGSDPNDSGAAAGFIAAGAGTDLNVASGSLTTTTANSVVFWGGATSGGPTFTKGVIAGTTADAIHCTDAGDTCLSANVPIIAVEYRIVNSTITSSTNVHIALGSSLSRLGNTRALHQ